MAKGDDPAASSPPPGALRRDLGLAQSVAIGLGAMIGTGLMAGVGLVSSIYGPAVLGGIVLAGALAYANARSSAELAVAFPTSGGVYDYATRLVHPWAGFAAGWLFVLSKIGVGAATALALSMLAKEAGFALPIEVGLPAAVGLMTLANLMGIRKIGWLNLVLVGVTVSTLVTVSLLALPSMGDWEFLTIRPWTMDAVVGSAAQLFFAFTGYARLATLAEEVRDPATTLPRAVSWSVGLVLALILLVTTVYLGVIGGLPPAGGDFAPWVLARAAQVPGLDHWTVLAMTAAMLGVLLSLMLGVSRTMLAMARRGDLPEILSRVNARRSVPVPAVLAASLLILVMSVSSDLLGLFQIAMVSILLYYALANVAALRLPAEQKSVPRWVAWSGLAGCLALAVTLPLTQWVLAGGWLVVGFALRAGLHWWHGRSPTPAG